MAGETSKSSKGSKSDALASIYSSPSFKFLVGPDKKEYFIHKSLVAKLSPALDALVNGGMKEAREGFVEWPDVDEETFARFADFAYTGDYAAGKPEILLGEADIGKHPAPDTQQSQEGPPTKKRRTGNGSSDGRSAPVTPATVIEIDSSGSEEDSEDETDSGESDSSSTGEEEGGQYSGSEEESESDSDDDHNIPGNDGHDHNCNGTCNHQPEEDVSLRWDDDYSNNESNPDVEGDSRWCRSSAHHYRSKGIRSSLQAINDDFFASDEAADHPESATFITRKFRLPYTIKGFLRANWRDISNPKHDALKPNVCRCYDCLGPTQAQTLRNGRVRLMKLLSALPQPSPAEAELDYAPPDIQVSRFNTECESFGPVLLSHAKLWVMGDIYDIACLRLLAAMKFNCTLMWFTLYEKRVGDIAEVARYIYDNSVDTGEVVGLRPIIALYLASVMEDVAHTQEISDLLAENGELARDVVKMMVKAHR